MNIHWLTSVVCLFLVAVPAIGSAAGNPYEELRRELARARTQSGRDIAPIAAPVPPSEPAAKREVRRREQQLDLHGAIVEIAEKNGIPAALLATIVVIESSGDPCAVSRAGAKGLTQLMPATASRSGLRDAYEPGGNLDTGAKLIRELLDKNEGRLLAAAAAYNAGEGVLNRTWRQWPAETRDYLDKILRYYPQYTDDRWKARLPRYIADASAASCRQ